MDSAGTMGKPEIGLRNNVCTLPRTWGVNNGSRKATSILIVSYS